MARLFDFQPFDTISLAEITRSGSRADKYCHSLERISSPRTHLEESVEGDKGSNRDLKDYRAALL